MRQVAKEQNAAHSLHVIAMASEASSTLFKWPEAHGLPSVSPACIQAEAYLRMTKQPFVISNCTSATRSPTGRLPALDVASEFPSSDEQDFGAARACITLAQKAIKDLDNHLSTAQKAELLAFTTLVQTKLDAATEYSMWIEQKGYQAHIKVAYSSQPFPLNLVMPWNARREVMRRYSEQSAEHVYQEACTVLKALADRLRASESQYLMGNQPSSLDAIVFGHLMFYRSSPSAAPMLLQAVTGQPVLQQYADRILTTFFNSPVPTVNVASSRPASQTQATPTSSSSQPSASPSSSKWSDAAKGQSKPQKTPEMTALEREFRKRSWWWLGGVATVIVGYFLLSGRYNVSQLVQALQQADEDDHDLDEEDDMEGHEPEGDD